MYGFDAKLYNEQRRWTIALHGRIVSILLYNGCSSAKLLLLPPSISGYDRLVVEEEPGCPLLKLLSFSALAASRALSLQAKRDT